MQITKITAREILDSRANPTIETEVTLENGKVYTASVPSGASRGQHEAIEKRDEDPSRYFGMGVRQAVDGINSKIAPLLVGQPITRHIECDSIMIALDGTGNKSNLGANAILSVSFALLRAMADSVGLPVYRYLGGAYRRHMPIPMMNILNGGVHASNNIDIQEFMIVPVGAGSFAEAVRMGSEVYKTLKVILEKHAYNTSVGDEGGFAPSLNSDAKALSIITEAIEKAGYRVGDEIALAIDVAASEWYKDGKYIQPKSKKEFTREKMAEYIYSLICDYPIVSVEDGMADDDIDGWRMLGSMSVGECMLVGDDLFVTDYRRISDYSAIPIANSVLIKPNQIGTLRETALAIDSANRVGYRTIMSHRSGETEDTLIADLAVGFGTEYVKMGAPARSERVAKYNRLMKIEDEIYSATYGI